MKLCTYVKVEFDFETDSDTVIYFKNLSLTLQDRAHLGLFSHKLTH